MISFFLFLRLYIFFFFFLLLFFFFQAEDGIRDLVRSRGLGDVYKRQRLERARERLDDVANLVEGQRGSREARAEGLALEPVSYTHLTLPTSDLV